MKQAQGADFLGMRRTLYYMLKDCELTRENIIVAFPIPWMLCNSNGRDRDDKRSIDCAEFGVNPLQHPHAGML